MSLNDSFSVPRAGLYGAGAFGRFLLKTLADRAVVAVTAIASRTYQHALDAATEYGIHRVHRDFEQLIGDPDLDLIIIATPPAEHAPQTLEAIASGKHVLVEKPLATSLESAERVVAAAGTRRRIVAVDYPMPYSPLIEAVALFAKSRLVGPLLRISIDNIASRKGIGGDHWFWNKKLSGGIFVEHGVHFFDWVGRIAGDATSVAAVTLSEGRREDRVFAVMTHAGGIIASHYHAFVAQPETERTRSILSFESVDIILEGWIPTKMLLEGPGAAVAITTIRRMMNRTVSSVPNARLGFIFDAGPKQDVYQQAVRAAIEDMVRAIHEPGYVARNDARIALASQQIAEVARDAAESGTTLDVAPMKISAQP